MNEYHAAEKPGPTQKTDESRQKRLGGLFTRLRGRHESPRPKLPAPATPKVCPVCNLFSHIASKSGGQEHVGLKLFNPLLDLGAGPRKCDIKIDNQSLIDLLQKRASQKDSFDPWLGSGDLLDVDSPVLYSACSDSVVPPLTINYGTISHWLRVCSRDHPDTCGASSKLDLHLYALECHNLTIVSLKPGQSYVALSYVWGPSADPSAVSSSPGNRRRANRLVESELPLTVKDAIKVVTRLGLRFLWVDRYCIPQTNVEHKRQAIIRSCCMRAECLLAHVIPKDLSCRLLRSVDFGCIVSVRALEHFHWLPISVFQDSHLKDFCGVSLGPKWRDLILEVVTFMLCLLEQDKKIEYLRPL